MPVQLIMLSSILERRTIMISEYTQGGDDDYMAYLLGYENKEEMYKELSRIKSL